MTEKAKTGSGGRRPAVEWVFGAVSAAGVAGLVVFLGYQALFDDSRPAALFVSVEGVERVDAGTVVTVAVANRGGETASAVTVYASAPDASGRASQKQIEFDYIGAHAVRRGAVVFPGAVAPDALRLEIGGYAEP